MSMATPKMLPRLLLVEPQFMLRRTVTAVARDMGLAAVHEATGAAAARRALVDQVFDALVIALDEGGEVLDLLTQLRGGGLRSAAVIPITVTADRCDAPTALALKRLQVERLLLKPFRVKDVLDAVASSTAGTIKPSNLPGVA